MQKSIVCALIVLAACAAGLLWWDVPSAGEATPGDCPTVTVTDLAGRQVTLKQPIQRIVLVRGRDISALAMLLGSEIEEKLVAWGPDLEAYDGDTYRRFVSTFPRLADVPQLGSVYQDAVSCERVLALEPDLVIVDTFMIDRGYKCVGRLQRAGLPVLFLDFTQNPFRSAQRSLEVLARVLGKEDRAQQATTFIDAELDKVLARLSNLDEPQVSVYVEGGYQGVENYGPTYGYGYDAKGHMTAWGAILHRLRAHNIAAGVVPKMGPISPEYLLKADPDLIVVTGACWTSPPDTMHLGYYTEVTDARARLQAFTTRPGWSELTAVKTGQVYGLYHNFSMQMAEFVVLQQLAKWLYPSEFGDLDPEASLREFHERFMPVDYRGVFIIGLEKAK